MNNKFFACACCWFIASTSAAAAADPDETVLAGLNRDYVRAFLNSDVARYDELLAEDFTAVLADGRLVDKAEFLKMQQPGRPAPVTDLQLDEVAIRRYGDTALINGRVSYKRSDGVPAQRRYLDVYVRRARGWQAVSAQLTPIGTP